MPFIYGPMYRVSQTKVTNRIDAQVQYLCSHDFGQICTKFRKIAGWRCWALSILLVTFYTPCRNQFAIIYDMNMNMNMTRMRWRDPKRLDLQGGFFNWSARFSVPKWKTSCSQPGLVFHEIFNVKKLLVGWASFFILVLKIGRTS